MIDVLRGGPPGTEGGVGSFGSMNVNLPTRLDDKTRFNHRGTESTEKDKDFGRDWRGRTQPHGFPNLAFSVLSVPLWLNPVRSTHQAQVRFFSASRNWAARS